MTKPADKTDVKLMTKEEIDAELAELKAREKLLNKVRRLLVELEGGEQS